MQHRLIAHTIWLAGCSPRLVLITLCLLGPMVLASGATAATPVSNDYVTMVSESGDYIGGGTDRLFNEPEAVSVSGGHGYVDVEAEAKGDRFSFEFAAPSGKELEVGEYAEAERSGFATGSPGIGVSGDGRGCNQDFGRFVIKDIHVGPLGNVERFWALYEQHCEGTGAPALFGEISFGEPPTTAPEHVQPSAIEWPHTAVGAQSVQVPVIVTAGESGAQVESVSLTGTDPSDFATASDTCAGTTLTPREACQIALSTTPTAAGPRAAELIVTDKSGAKTLVPLSVNPNPPPPPPASNNYVTVVSEPGDFIGGGTDRLFNEPEAISVTGRPGYVKVQAEAKGQRFSFEFAAPSGRELEVGEYAEAERYPFETKGSPGISVSANSSGCNQDFGRFVIKDIHFGPLGNVERFWALYEQHCEGNGEPALFGEINVGEPPTTAPEAVQPSAIEWPHTAVGASSVQVPVTVTAGESGAQVESVSIAGADPSDFAVAGDTCTGTTLTPRARCQVALTAKPTKAGPRAAELILTDKSGAKTIVQLSVNPNPPPPLPASNDYVTMVSETGDWVGGGTDRLFNEPEAVSVSGGPGYVDVQAEAKGNSFSFEFAAASGKELEVGEYTEAERYPFETRGSPGISVSGDGRGCNQDFGRFVIEDIHFGPSGNVERFRALYEQDCEGRRGPVLFGEISFGEGPTTAPEAVQPSAIEWRHTAVGASSLQVPVTVTAGESGAQVESVSIAGADPSDFAVAGDTCTGTTLTPRARCQVALTAKPTKAGPRAAELILTDKSGARTIVSLDAEALAPEPPHALTWSGESAGHTASSASWSLAANWEGGVAPAGSDAIGALTFPRLPNAACTSSTPADACYLSFNNVRGLSAESVQLDDANDYLIAGEEIAIGGGGLTASPASGTAGEAGNVVETPLHLSASQTWHLAGRTGAELGENGLLLGGDVAGAASALNVELSDGPALYLAEDDTEVGPVTIHGANTGEVAANGVVALLGARLDSADEQSVMLSHIFFTGSGAVGRLTTSDADLDVGSPAEGLEATSARLDSASNVEFNVTGEGTTAQTDYSQMTSHGAIELAGARVEVVVRKPSTTAACPTLLPGQTYTFVSTTGTLSGFFSNAPEHGAEVPIRFAQACPQKSQTIRIAYHESGTTQTVTGVVEEAAKKKQEEEAAAKKTAEEEAAAKKTAEEEAAAKKTAEEEAASTAKRAEERAAATREKAEDEAAAKKKQGEGNSGGSGSAGGVLGDAEVSIGPDQVTALLRQELTPTGKAALIATLVKVGGLTVSFKALGPGAVIIDWYYVPLGAKLTKNIRAEPMLVASGHVTFSSAGSARVKIKLTPAGKRLLKTVKSVWLTARGTFVPTGKAPVIATKMFLLKK